MYRPFHNKPVNDEPFLSAKVQQKNDTTKHYSHFFTTNCVGTQSRLNRYAMLLWTIHYIQEGKK